MPNPYSYVLDAMADWEAGLLAAELYSGRFFRRRGESVTVRTISATTELVTTMGGPRVVPDAAVDVVTAELSAVFVLPGADAWDDPRHVAVVDKAAALLGHGANVAAMCGPTGALARAGPLARGASTRRRRPRSPDDSARGG